MAPPEEAPSTAQPAPAVAAQDTERAHAGDALLRKLQGGSRALDRLRRRSRPGQGRQTESTQAPAAGSGPDRDGPPSWVLAVLAGLLVAALALDGFVVWREVSQHRAQEEAARAMHSAVIQAPSVAERSAEALLSFRHDTVRKDVAQARSLLSDRYAPDYIESIRAAAGPAAQTKATVKAEVLSSGVVEASGERADVLLFVNQTTNTPGQEPQTALNRVVFTMIPVESGWQVDEIKAF